MLGQMLGHVLNVQHETTVSVFLGFTLHHALVRQQFVLSSWKYVHSYLACGVCALQSSNAARQQQSG